MFPTSVPHRKTACATKKMGIRSCHRKHGHASAKVKPTAQPMPGSSTNDTHHATQAVVSLPPQNHSNRVSKQRGSNPNRPTSPIPEAISDNSKRRCKHTRSCMTPLQQHARAVFSFTRCYRRGPRSRRAYLGAARPGAEAAASAPQRRSPPRCKRPSGSDQ